MDAMEFLSQAFRLDQQIQSKVDQLARIRACIGVSALRYGDVKVQASGVNSPTEDAVLKILEEERVINEEIDRLVDIKRRIRWVIDQVGDVTLRLLLEKRSLLFEPWLKICGDLCMSRRWAQIMYGKAVEVVQGILNRMEEDG